MKDQDLNSEIFKFDKRNIDSYILRTLNIKNKFKKSFAYVFDKLLPMNSKKKALLTNTEFDLEKLTWYEGKNYDWIALTDNIKNPLIQLLIRQYENHFTIFFKYKYKVTEDPKIDEFFYTRSGVFTFYTNIDKLSDKEHDSYIDDRFKDLNKYLPEIIKLMREDNIDSVWNSYSLKLESEKQRPKHIEAKCSWDGGDTISSVDEIIFAVEELFQKHLELFAQTDMIEKIKTLKKGDMVGSYEVLDVRTKVKDDYYHEAGLNLKGTNGKDSDSWCDVYSLTRWYYEAIFPPKETEQH